MRRAQALAERGELLSRTEQRAQAEQERQAADARPTVATFGTAWLADRLSLRPRTRDSYAAILRLHIIPALGTTPVAELTSRSVRLLLEGMAAPDATGRVRTAATISRTRSVLSAMLQAAVADDLLAVNPARGVKLPEGAAQSRAVRSPTAVESSRLLALASASAEFGPVTRFIAATGVRRSEACGLRWEHIDLDAGAAVISEALHRMRGRTYTTAPKSRAGWRSVPLDAETVTWLRDYRRTQAEEAMRWGRASWNPEGYLFTRADGSPVLPDSVSHAVKRWWAQLDAPGLGIHSLRHSWATAALTAGIDVKVVSDVLGHSTTTLTRDRYQHTTPELAAQAAEAIAALRRGVQCVD